MRSFDKHASLEKRLRQLSREHRRLQHAQWHAPIVPLARAFQRGWEKTYVLREDIRRRPDMRVFAEVLAEVNQRLYSRNREFTDRQGHPLVLRPRIIPVAEWLQLDWPASHQRLFAYGHWRLEDGLWRPERWRRHILGFRLVRAWWLAESVQPFMVTHQRVDLPEVRSRLAEIDAFMTARRGWQRLGRLQGHSRWWRHLTTTRAELRQIAGDAAQMEAGVT